MVVLLICIEYQSGIFASSGFHTLQTRVVLVFMTPSQHFQLLKIGVNPEQTYLVVPQGCQHCSFSSLCSQKHQKRDNLLLSESG